jgi:hypothetical protein
MNPQRYIYIIRIGLVSSTLLSNCISSEPLFEAPTPSTTATPQTATLVPPVSSDTPSPTSTPSLQPPTGTATIQTGAEPSWCDDFDDGTIDQSRWNLPTDSTIIYEQNGTLNFRVIEEQSRDNDAWAGLDAKQAGQPISEVSYTIALESYGENVPGGVGVDIFLMNEDPLYSFDIGPGPNGAGGEFSFCPNYDAGYDDCEHPTPLPDKASLSVNLQTPMQVRVVDTGKDITFYVDNELRANRPVNAPIENFQFYVYADPGSTLHAAIDNVCVTYISNS